MKIKTNVEVKHHKSNLPLVGVKSSSVLWTLEGGKGRFLNLKHGGEGIACFTTLESILTGNRTPVYRGDIIEVVTTKIIEM